jgi:surface protein
MSASSFQPANRQLECFKVTNMGSMFKSASSFNQPIGDWNVSSVTNMSNMFRNSVFNQPTGDWNVSAVTTMGAMFSNAISFNQPIGNWDVSKVTNMQGVFNGASSFNQPIGEWNTSNVLDMQQMFMKGYSFNQAIGDWNVAAVTNMRGMFYGAAAFNQAIGDWDVSGVRDMAAMFKGAASFNKSIGDWDIQSVEAFDYMFQLASSFNQDLGKWRISNQAGVDGFFTWADSLSLTNRKKIHATFSSNPNWTYDWGTFYHPIPKVEFVHVGNDLNYTFSGKIMATGGMPVTSVAFELADNMFFRKAQTNPTTLVDGNFSVSLILEAGKRYYYRAVAVNEVGTSHSGPKRLQTPASQTYWWSDALVQGFGWKTLPWFGTFRPYENGWIYHLKLGWVFVHPEETSGLWLWKKNMGWIWTKESVYPYFWKIHDGSWQYLVGSINSSPIFQEWREDFSRTN